MSKTTRAKTNRGPQAQFPSGTAAEASHPHDGVLVLATESGFRAILDNLLEGCQIIDRNWRYIYVNPAVASQGQTTPAALIGRTMMEAYPGLESSALFPILERCMFERIPATLNNEFAFVDGSTGVFELRVQPVPEGIFILSIDVTEKKRAEDALANERKRLEKIADAVPGLICTIVQHPTGRVTIPYASKAIDTIFGFTAAEVADNFALIAQRVSAEDNVRLLGAMRQAAATMQAWHSEYQYQHPQRGWIWLEGHATPVRDEDGAIHWHGVIMDATTRKTGEQALYASEETYRGLVESLDSVVAVVHASGRFLYVNELGAHQLGKDQNTLIGKTMADLFPEPFASNQMKNVRSVIEADEALVVENQSFVRGEPRWYRTSIQPLHDDDGTVTRALLTSTDITQQKRTQRELEELNRTLEQRVLERTAQLQDLYDNAPVGYHSLDAQGKFVMINQTELNWLGYTREEVIGRMTIAQFLAPYSQELFDRTFVIFKSQGWVKDVELDFVRKDGSVLPVSVTAAAVMSPYGEFIMSRSTVSEITERKQAETELRARQEELSAANAALAKAARLKDEFLASMSHELRTPLTGILGLSEALQMEVYGALNAKQAKSIHSIEESGRHLLNLINDILDLSKIEAGKLELELSDVNVDDLCQASLRMIKQMAATKEQSVTYALHPTGLTIRADTRRLKQTIVNLLSNAVKFTPDGGELGLLVEADRTRRVIYFTVWDKGIGIAPEATGRLFKPFVQLDSSLARSEGGTGLGLSLVQRLVELHGGSVALESTPGQGSRFTIAIPWLEASKVTLERPSLTADIRATIASVLVLDDSPTAVDLVAGYLRELGVQKVIVQTRAEGAMERIRAAKPAAIILDILLPDGSGWDILRQLKADPAISGIPVIVISVIDDRPKALQLGAVEHVLKPISRSDLQLALNTARRAVETERHEPVMVVSGNPDRETILLAEDHEISRMLVSDFLTAQGYAMLTAQNGNEALQLLQEVSPALILMDIQMPGMDGLEAIRTVRGLQELRRAHVPIIALTALSMPGDRERCLAMGADLYMSKPVDFKELAVSIRTLLDRGDLTGARVASEG